MSSKCEFTDCTNKDTGMCDTCTNNTRFKSYYERAITNPCKNGLCIYYRYGCCANSDYKYFKDKGTNDCSCQEIKW